VLAGALSAQAPSGPSNGSTPAQGGAPAQLPAAVMAQIRSASLPHSAQPVEIALDPVELGKIRMQLKATDTGMIVVISAERSDTLSLIRQHAGQLAADIRQAGYRDVGFDFSQSGSRDQHPAPQDHPRFAAPAWDEALPTQAADTVAGLREQSRAAGRLRAPGPRLDIRI